MAQQTSAIPEPQPAPKRTWQLSPKTIRTRLAYKVAFADRLKSARHSLGIGEQKAAAAYGVTLKTYRRYEAAQSRPCCSRRLELRADVQYRPSGGSFSATRKDRRRDLDCVESSSVMAPPGRPCACPAVLYPLLTSLGPGFLAHARPGGSLPVKRLALAIALCAYAESTALAADFSAASTSTAADL